jgi:hypothetical protein
MLRHEVEAAVIWGRQASQGIRCDNREKCCDPVPSLVPTESADHHGGQWVLRRVGSNGVVSVDNQMFSVGDAYKKALVDIFVDDTTIQVWSQNHLIKTVARVRKGAVRGSGLMASMSNIRRSQTVEHQWNLTTTHSHFPKSEAISSSQLLGMEWWNDTISTRTPAISMWFSRAGNAYLGRIAHPASADGSTLCQASRATCCLPASSSGPALRVSRSPVSSAARSCLLPIQLGNRDSST